MLEIKNSLICISLTIILLLTSCASLKMKTTEPSIDSSQLIAVKGKIEISGSYCGGVAPTEQMLQEARKKKPLVDYKLYIRAGEKNDLNAVIVDSTLTDSNGEFMFQLNKGKYLLISANQKNKDIFNTYKNNKDYELDIACMEKWWQNGIIQLTVDNPPIEDIYFHFRKRCFYPLNIFCLSFHGPVPP